MAHNKYPTFCTTCKAQAPAGHGTLRKYTDGGNYVTCGATAPKAVLTELESLRAENALLNAEVEKLFDGLVMLKDTISGLIVLAKARGKS